MISFVTKLDVKKNKTLFYSEEKKIIKPAVIIC